MIQICVFLFLLGISRTLLWQSGQREIFNQLNDSGIFSEFKPIIGYGQIQRLKWGGVEVYCLDGTTGLEHKSLVLFGLNMPKKGWIKFKLNAAHPLTQKGFLAFYATANTVSSSGFSAWILDLRLRIRQRLLESFYQSFNKFKSLTLFWTSSILREQSKEHYQLKSDLKQLGLGAIFAVSGLHINMLSLIIVLILAFIPVRNSVRWMAFTLLLIFYASLVGFTASVLRAVSFAFLMRIGENSFHDRRNIRILSVVFMLHILIFPNEVLEPGFLLSYGLTFVLIFLAESFPSRNFISVIIQGCFLQLLLMPYFLWQFGEYPLMHFFGVFLAPIFSLILALGFLVICFSQFNAELTQMLFAGLGSILESFIILCSQWGQQSQWVFTQKDSFDGRWVICIYALLVVIAMRIRRFKSNYLDGGIAKWEHFLSELNQQPYEVHSAVYRSLFHRNYEPIESLRSLQINLQCRMWSVIAYEHFMQEWVSYCYSSFLEPIRNSINVDFRSVRRGLSPLQRHFIEGSIHLKRSEKNLLNLSAWLLSQEFEKISSSKLSKIHRSNLRKILARNFPTSFLMRALRSKVGVNFNHLPIFIRCALTNYLCFSLRINHT